MTIHNENPSSPLNGIIDQMRASKWNFYLTGSRFFETHTSTSDWDFFTEPHWSNACVNFLISLGFTYVPFDKVMQMEDGSYYDPSVSLVLVHEAGIHVQILCSGFSCLKQKIQQSMNNIPGYTILEKDEKKRQWIFAWELMREFGPLPNETREDNLDNDANKGYCPDCGSMFYPCSDRGW